MTLPRRVFYGALLGALVTLLVHPASRAYITRAFVFPWNQNQRVAEQLPPAFPNPLPNPGDPLNASYWIHVASERLLNGDSLSDKQLLALKKVAEQQSMVERRNSFWPMAEAIILSKLNQPDKARAMWESASRCLDYDDKQTMSLEQLRTKLAETYYPAGWQFAYCYRLRSTAFSRLAAQYARSLANTLSTVTAPDLKTRYATLVNGGLIRDRSRHLGIMESGVSIVEIASHPKELLNDRSVKRLIIAHYDMKEALRKIGMVEESEAVEKSYNENEGWSALTKREDTEENVKILTLQSAVWPTLPGAFLQCAILGALLSLLGKGLERLSLDRPKIASVAYGIFGTLLSLSSWFLTNSCLAFLATTFCCLFMLLSPRTPRKRIPEQLGPLLQFVVIVLMIALVAFTALAVLTRTLPVQASLGAFDPTYASLADTRLAAVFALFVIAGLFLLSPLWALAQHITSKIVLSKAIKMLGVSTGTLGLILAVFSTPFCVYMESETGVSLKKLMENEPLYYYVVQ